MLRKSLIGIALLAASAGAMAGGDYVYGRVVLVEPSFSISIGSGRHHDGFRILYEVGGERYWTHSHYHPGQVIWVPRPVVRHVHYYKYKHHHRHGWQDRRHDGWDDRDDRWDDRRDGRGDWGGRR